jgi:nitroreductase
MSASTESEETLRLIAQRRSTPIGLMTGPGPSPADVDQLLRLAMRAPDHRKLEPWRFLVFEGAARERLGDIFAAAAADPLRADARALPLRAPVVIAVISSPVDDPKKTPVWEQELSVGAVCQTLLLSAFASGWAACWLTEQPAFDAGVAASLGLTARERIAGFIYLGTAREAPLERQRPHPATRVKRWPG